MKNIYLKRLRTLVQILKDAKGKPGFDMQFTTWDTEDGKYPCGTPACVLGHFAARTDKQKIVGVDPKNGAIFPLDGGVLWWSKVREYLGVTDTEMNLLFGANGCGDAKTRPQAIKFIEKFIADKEART